jgi:hypothetical protein
MKYLPNEQGREDRREQIPGLHAKNNMQNTVKCSLIQSKTPQVDFFFKCRIQVPNPE